MEYLVRTQPKSVSFEPRGTAHGLTAEELAAHLLGVHDGVFYLAMTIVGGQDHRKIITHYLYNNNLPKLYQNYRMDDSERGRGMKDGFLWNLTHLAVTEYADPSKCVSCGGGEGIETTSCPECGGKGWLRANNEQKSRYLKILPKRFNYWASMYEGIYNILRDWEADAKETLRVQDIEI